ncbi:hypothetical protein GOODEAATRI_004022, partial [Goodea atripinnis]
LSKPIEKIMTLIGAGIDFSRDQHYATPAPAAQRELTPPPRRTLSPPASCCLCARLCWPRVMWQCHVSSSECRCYRLKGFSLLKRFPLSAGAAGRLLDQPVGDWLEHVGLPQYESKLLLNGFDDLHYMHVISSQKLCLIIFSCASTWVCPALSVSLSGAHKADVMASHSELVAKEAAECCCSKMTVVMTSAEWEQHNGGPRLERDWNHRSEPQKEDPACSTLLTKALGCDGSSSLSTWLENLGLHEYLPNFLASGYRSLDCVKNLWELEIVNVSHGDKHEIRNISCAAQDPEDLCTFAYITKDLQTSHHYCHVFSTIDVVR